MLVYSPLPPATLRPARPSENRSTDVGSRHVREHHTPRRGMGPRAPPAFTSFHPSHLPSNASLEGCLALLSVDGTDEVDYNWRLVLRSDADYEFWLSQCGQYGRAGNLGCGYYPPLGAN